MSAQKKQTIQPAYTTDRRQLVQITEIIVNGETIIQSTPLHAYQTIQLPTKS